MIVKHASSCVWSSVLLTLDSFSASSKVRAFVLVFVERIRAFVSVVVVTLGFKACVLFDSCQCYTYMCSCYFKGLVL